MEMTRFSCPHAKQCGGCQLLQLPYPAQLEKKQRLVEELFGQYTPVQPILGMEHPVHYRNKIHATFGKGRNGRVVSGLYQPSSHRLVPIEHCLLEDEAAAEILAVVRQLMDQLHLPPYNDVTHTGLIRHLLIRRGYFSGQILVAVVTGQAAFPARKQFAEALRKACPQITTLVQNINPGRTSMVLGGQQRILYGPGYIEDQLCGCTFRISAASFYQVNPIQTQKLYQAALDMAGLTGAERVIDAYCGTGTIGILAARQAGQVLGVELNRAAVTDAIANARRNKAENIRFVCQDAGQFMVELARQGQTADLVLMDPPRAGSDQAFLSSLAVLGPKKVVYISCNPLTQKRDVEYLARKGYRVKAAQPVDLFPHTDHVENILLLVKQSPRPPRERAARRPQPRQKADSRPGRRTQEKSKL